MRENIIRFTCLWLIEISLAQGHQGNDTTGSGNERSHVQSRNMLDDGPEPVHPRIWSRARFHMHYDSAFLFRLTVASMLCLIVAIVLVYIHRLKAYNDRKASRDLSNNNEGEEKAALAVLSQYHDDDEDDDEEISVFASNDLGKKSINNDEVTVEMLP
ncbi:hypothetical protein HDE_02681 [Halotydeus destructor]|nr:hypothetical protein HDE_02681 [Halotydeus destructor]